MRPTFNQYFMLMARIASMRSTCLSRPVGAIITKNNRIISVGYCGSMEGDVNCIDEKVCFRRALGVEDKDKLGYCLSCHAEANAIANAARCGVSCEGGTLYTTLSPCLTCFKQIVNAGIERIMYDLLYESKDKERDRWWGELMNQSKVKMNKLLISNEITSSAANYVSHPPSMRRLESK